MREKQWHADKVQSLFLVELTPASYPNEWVPWRNGKTLCYFFWRTALFSSFRFKMTDFLPAVTCKAQRFGFYKRIPSPKMPKENVQMDSWGKFGVSPFENVGILFSFSFCSSFLRLLSLCLRMIRCWFFIFFLVLSSSRTNLFETARFFFSPQYWRTVGNLVPVISEHQAGAPEVLQQTWHDVLKRQQPTKPFSVFCTFPCFCLCLYHPSRFKQWKVYNSDGLSQAL